MAVSGKPNSAYIVDSVIADLKQIKISNGYYSDVKTVTLPSWDYRDGSHFSQVEDSALLIWLDALVAGETSRNFQEERPSMAFTIVGVVRREQGLQEAMLLLAEDIRRVMMSNPQRNHPSNPTQNNSWGVLTKEDGGVDFQVHRNEQGVTIGVFTSSWRVDYRFPKATG